MWGSSRSVLFLLRFATIATAVTFSWPRCSRPLMTRMLGVSLGEVMRVPIGNRYSATVSGRAWTPVDCEFCGTAFEYELTREAEGTGASLLWR